MDLLLSSWLIDLNPISRGVLATVLIANVLGIVMVLWDKTAVSQDSSSASSAPLVPVTLVAAAGGTPAMILSLTLFKHGFKSPMQNVLFVAVILGQIVLVSRSKEWILAHLVP